MSDTSKDQIQDVDSHEDAQEGTNQQVGSSALGRTWLWIRAFLHHAYQGRAARSSGDEPAGSSGFLPDSGEPLSLWLRVRPSLADIGIAVLVAAMALLAFRWLTDWSSLDLNSPLSYNFDPLATGNFTFNQQLGNWATSGTLGAPMGQQLGLSAYGTEWVAYWLTGHFAPGTDGPWLAIFRYLEFSYLTLGFTSYLALRWIKVNRVLSAIGALAFTLIPFHQQATNTITLASLAAYPLVLAIAFRLASGSTISELVPQSWRIPERLGRRCGLVLVLICVLVGLMGANYYMIFDVFILGSVAIIMLARRVWWPRARRLFAATALALVPLVFAYSPIIIGRLSNGLGLREPALVDRRAFAAYANAGDPFTLLLPFKDSAFFDLLSHFPEAGRFFNEWFGDQITAYMYIDFMGGMAVIGAVLLVALGLVGAYRRSDFLRRVSPMSSLAKATVLVGTLAALWYYRGGIGTWVAFVFPDVRGYARMDLLVVFSAIALLAIAGSSSINVRSRLSRLVTSRASKLTTPAFPPRIRWLAVLLLLFALFDSVTANQPYVQTDPQAVASVYAVTERDIKVQVAGFGLQVQGLGPQGTKDLVHAAEERLSPGCTVLTLPLASFPVDFELGLTSYFSYEELKPGLMPSSLKWTAGGFPGTPNNAFTDQWLQPYRAGDYANVLVAADQAGYCGAVIWSSLQEGFYRAGPLNGSKFVTPVSEAQAALVAHYGRPCFEIEAAHVQLYCRRA